MYILIGDWVVQRSEHASRVLCWEKGERASAKKIKNYPTVL